MAAPLTTDIADFTRKDFTFKGKTKPVLMIGDTGPAVIVIHEIFGFTPAVARFCRWLRDAGFRVYAPVLLGKPDASNAEEVNIGRTLGLCVSREFHIFKANASSPIVDWLKPLARQVHADCGGKGVGVVGMCFSGGFALSMAVDPVVMAPVVSQPGMPPFDKPALDISPQELAIVAGRCVKEGLQVRGYRFASDPIAPAEKFETLKVKLGDGFVGTTFPDEVANPDGMMAKGRKPHSVFTGDLIDAPHEPTRQAVDEVIAFFSARLK